MAFGIKKLASSISYLAIALVVIVIVWTVVKHKDREALNPFELVIYFHDTMTLSTGETVVFEGIHPPLRTDGDIFFDSENLRVPKWMELRNAHAILIDSIGQFYNHTDAYLRLSLEISILERKLIFWADDQGAATNLMLRSLDSVIDLGESLLLDSI